MTDLPSNPAPSDTPAGPGASGAWQQWQGSLWALLIIGSLWTLCLHVPAVWRSTGIGETPVPFLDLYGSLAAGDVAHAHGDPYQPNPLDPFHRPHLYTRWWLITADLGLTRADTLWLGYVLLGATLLSALATIRPHGKTEIVHTALFFGSPAILMAVSRANNDLVVFIVLCAALALLRSAATGFRLLGFALLAVAAALKYYPLATVVLLLAARSPRERAVALAIFGTVLIAAWPALQPGLASAARFAPRTGGFYAFGAPTLFREFDFSSPLWWLVPAVALGAWAVWLARQRWNATASSRGTSPLTSDFACSAVLIVGCFFLGASYVYKLIFAAWLLPTLWRGGAGESSTDQPWRHTTLFLLLGVLWWEGVLAVVINVLLTPLSPGLAQGVYYIAFVVSQLLTWGLIASLTRALVCYVVDGVGGATGRRSPSLASAP